MLRIRLDKVCAVIALAREAMGIAPEEEAAETGLVNGAPLPSSEDYDEAKFDSLLEYVNGLSAEELADLLALAWLGQGEFTVDEWEDARAEAEREMADGDMLTELIQDPTLPDELEAGLEELGLGCPED